MSNGGHCAARVSELFQISKPTMVVTEQLRLPYSTSGLFEGLFVEVTGCVVAVLGVTASEGTDREVSVCDGTVCEETAAYKVFHI